jgi:hypothetical protein
MERLEPLKRLERLELLEFPQQPHHPPPYAKLPFRNDDWDIFLILCFKSNNALFDDFDRPLADPAFFSKAFK